MTSPDLSALYERMLKSRLFEEAVAGLWHAGAISGEMHLGTGEEAVVAGVTAHLREGDAMALDHRGTAAMLMRGVDPGSILRELLGRPEGLCGGMGGHMHLFSKRHLAASSGIVGASGPAAAGFALSALHQRPGAVAVAFFGDGALNQGMLMESMNLAAAWKLPLLFVCKDDGWAITTRTEEVTGGDPLERARGLGVYAVDVEGREVAAVWEAAGAAIERARAGGGPSFLRARCVHLEAHFLGFQLARMTRKPVREIPRTLLPVLKSFLHPGGAGAAERLSGLGMIFASVLDTLRDPRRDPENDPVARARRLLINKEERLRELEERAERETGELFASLEREERT